MSPGSATVLGISASHHGAAALLVGTEVRAAIAEERVVRQKQKRFWAADPALCLRYCLDTARLEPADLDRIVVAPQKGSQRAVHDVALNPTLRVAHHGVPTTTVSHHLAHAASTFGTSGFDEAAVLVVDGVGSSRADVSPAERALAPGADDDHEVISLYHATRTGLHCVHKQWVPGEGWLTRDAWLGRACPRMPRFASLGGMFGAVATQVFGNQSDAGKVMGLAAYGRPTIAVSDFFAWDGVSFGFSEAVPDRYLDQVRWPDRQERYADLAASVQAALEEAMLLLAARARELLPGVTDLCLAGGVTLNSVANQRLAVEAGFTRMHVIPAADDGGAALGAAYLGLLEETGTLPSTELRSDALGRAYTATEVDAAIARTPGLAADRSSRSADAVVDLLVAGQTVGYFSGRSEYGPRALGHRSILADPRRAESKDVLNRKVKHREPFRPFGAMILEERVPEWFDLQGTPARSPFMLRVINVRPEVRHRIPAIVHPDGTCRIQTVAVGDEPVLHDLLSRFEAATGVPLIINTSFNVMGEPIVETPGDALWVLQYTALDAVAFDHVVVTRSSDVTFLDLVPRLADDLLEVHERRSLLAVGPATPEVQAVLATPYGPINRLVTGEVAAVLARVDGRTTVAELVTALGEDVQTGRALAELRRAGMVDFEGPGVRIP
jgi:carbamoyltransferase